MATSGRLLPAAAVTAAAGIAIVLVVMAPGGPGGRGQAGSRQIPPFVPRPAPPGWHRASLPHGDGVLAYPPIMARIGGDAGTVSAARYSRGSGYLLYLNATPRQGTESLHNFPKYRLRILLGEDASSARETSASLDVSFRGGTGSCVQDSYLTKAGGHEYTELACFVQGKTSASVVVAAAPAARWPGSASLLRRAVASYQVR